MISEGQVTEIQSQIDEYDVQDIIGDISDKLFVPASGERSALLFGLIEGVHLASRLRAFIKAFEDATSRPVDALLVNPVLAKTVQGGALFDIQRANPSADLALLQNKTTYVLREGFADNGASPIRFQTADATFHPGVPLLFHPAVSDDVIVIISGGFDVTPSGVSVTSAEQCGIVKITQPTALYAAMAG